jgi:hypothetical protein
MIPDGLLGKYRDQTGYAQTSSELLARHPGLNVADSLALGIACASLDHRSESWTSFLIVDK